MQRLTRVVVLAALAAATASCGDVVRQGRAPVFLVIDRLEASRGGATTGEFGGTLFSDVITNVITPEPCAATNPCPTVFGDSGRVTLRIVPKDIGSPTAPTEPTSNNEVTITRYRVVYIRADGRNTQGVDVPYSLRFGGDRHGPFGRHAFARISAGASRGEARGAPHTTPAQPDIHRHDRRAFLLRPGPRRQRDQRHWQPS